MSQSPGGLYFVQTVHWCSVCSALLKETESLIIEKNITLAFVEPEYWDILFFFNSLFSCPAPGSSTSNFGGG